MLETGEVDNAYGLCINVCMRTTVNIDDELLAKARDYTGEQEKTKLLHLGLEALIQREVAKRLVALGGTMPDLELPVRRRSSRRAK
jgi:Arc/MetJ family transcription regulator